MMVMRWMIKRMVKDMMQIVIKEPYDENIMELMPGIKRYGIQTVLENSLRSASEEVLHRPLGSSRDWPNFDSITFIPAQTSPFPISKDEEVDISITIGPKAKKPLKLAIPLIISGMAYGVALSKEAKVALAQAASQIGTATNSGEGPILQEEREAATKYIVQFSKTTWGKDEDAIKNADMIEIKLGQGALAGMGDSIPPDKIKGQASKLMGLKEGEDAVIHEQFFENQTLQDLKELVDSLRTMSDGVPIGAKIMAGGKIEEDIDRLIEIGVDVIAIDGGQASTRGAPTILQDDFGIPSLHAVIRATRHLKKIKAKDQVSLIVSGGFKTPGDYLKVLAFGADAVYLGSSVLYAISHGQNLKPIPWEPPTQIVWYDGKYKDDYEVEKGAKSGYRFLKASSEEMKVGLRAMGKRSLRELSIKDMVAYDEKIAKEVGVPFSLPSQEDSK